MNKYFNIDELDPDEILQEQPDKSGMMVEKFLFSHCEKVKNITKLIGKVPVEHEIIFLWTINSFNAFTFIKFIIDNCGMIDELIISTYSINIRIIDSLLNKINKNKIAFVTLFISETLQSRLPKVFHHLTALTQERSDKIQVIYRWNHSKIALMRCGDKYFDVEGSGNFSENAQHEQYIFLNSREVFEFRKNEILYGTKS